jgi:hypothetical protein
VDDVAENHRAVHGFRRGWLMFLGIPPDYRNDLDIANAVSTFGRMHYWNREDPILDRALVYASFPSPQLVPKDVVFGRFANVGGVKESWTTPLYILTADFADALSADEDHMPPDGNPHPMPGNLLHNENNFVMPQYPEIGWDAVPIQDAGDNVHNNVVPDQEVDHIEEVEEQQVSMVLNPSDNSGSSVNMADGPEDEVMGEEQQGHTIPFQNVNLQIGAVIIRPELPPEMVWRNMFADLMPLILSKEVPLSMKISPFMLAKSSCQISFHFGGEPNLVHWLHSRENIAKDKDMISVLARRRLVARALCFEADPSSGTYDSQPPIFSASPISMKKKRNWQARTPVVQPTQKRFTHSCLKTDGYRPKPILGDQPRPKKKQRSKLLLVEMVNDESKSNTPQSNAEPEDVEIPPTPIRVMQNVGMKLGIGPEKLTREQLEADPQKHSTSSSDD